MDSARCHSAQTADTPVSIYRTTLSLHGKSHKGFLIFLGAEKFARSRYHVFGSQHEFRYVYYFSH